MRSLLVLSLILFALFLSSTLATAADNKNAHHQHLDRLLNVIKQWKTNEETGTTTVVPVETTTTLSATTTTLSDTTVTSTKKAKTTTTTTTAIATTETSTTTASTPSDSTNAPSDATTTTAPDTTTTTVSATTSTKKPKTTTSTAAATESTTVAATTAVQSDSTTVAVDATTTAAPDTTTSAPSDSSTTTAPASTKKPKTTTTTPPNDGSTADPSVSTTTDASSTKKPKTTTESATTIPADDDDGGDDNEPTPSPSSIPAGFTRIVIKLNLKAKASEGLLDGNITIAELLKSKINKIIIDGVLVSKDSLNINITFEQKVNNKTGKKTKRILVRVIILIPTANPSTSTLVAAATDSNSSFAAALIGESGAETIAASTSTSDSSSTPPASTNAPATTLNPPSLTTIEITLTLKAKAAEKLIENNNTQQLKRKLRKIIVENIGINAPEGATVNVTIEERYNDNGNLKKKVVVKILVTLPASSPSVNTLLAANNASTPLASALMDEAGAESIVAQPAGSNDVKDNPPSTSGDFSLFQSYTTIMVAASISAFASFTISYNV